jgi:signal transduction histidine kinase
MTTETSMDPNDACEVQSRAGMKANWRGWLAGYVVVAVVITVLVMLLAPKVGWMRSILAGNMLSAGLVGVIASAWYGYSKYTGTSAKKNLVMFVAMMFAGGVVGGIIASVDIGKPITQVSPAAFAIVFGIVFAMAGVLVATILGIAHVRSRAAAQRVALLESEAERERFVRQGVQAELKLLQAQVEPHFLFNTLANLRFLVQTGSPHALEMLDHLIHYLRTALPEIRAESSTVGREIELARAYLEILRIRMGGALEISAEAPHDLAGVAFPPLVVLTLVENAIKHGIAPVGRGRVSVRAASESGRLRVIVEDDGRGLVEPIGQGLGLANVRERLRAIYGETARLDLTGRAGGGTVAAVEVPL